MKMNLGKRIVAVGLCSTLAVGAIGGTAYAYFTDQVKTSGTQELTMGYSTTTNEEIDEKDGTKRISITNTGPTEVMVRLLVFGAGLDDTRQITQIDGGDGWNLSRTVQNCWEYEDSLMPGDSTDKFVITMNDENKKEVTGDDPDEFHVIVVGQCSPTAYEGDKPYGYTWSDSGRVWEW